MTRNVANSRIYLFTKNAYTPLHPPFCALLLFVSLLVLLALRWRRIQPQQQHKSDDVDLHVSLRKEVIELAPWIMVVAELGYDVALVICDVDPPRRPLK